MTRLLLTTKLHVPPAHPNLVARPRLIERLNQGLKSPLTLVSAPPGFGKTTLLTAWLKQQPLPTAWYSVEERDNDLARFMAYLVAALDSLQPGVGKHALNRLHSRQMPPLESVMTLLCNDVAEMSHDSVLVLDDYHLIELPAIHEATTFLIDHLPTPLHLVIATRADPPLPLARLRARDQIVELRAPDLRFTREEAAAFLNQRMRLSLTSEQITALDSRAEGWIAGLQLAALSIQGHQNVAGFVHAFAGSHRYILDYLSDEVLQHQSPDIQIFLFQTCILDQMSAPLANAVTARNDSTQVLAQLEKANLFVVPLDDARQWYRYHHLFSDLLQSRLQESQPGQVAELHLRASGWYEQNGYVNEAIEHALVARDFDRAARMIDQAAPALLTRSEDRTLRSWLAALPDQVIRASSSLCLWLATADSVNGNFESAEERLSQVDDAQLDPFPRAIATLVRAYLGLYRSNLPQAIESARKALLAAGATTAVHADPRAELSNVTAAFLAILLAEAELAAGMLRDAATIYRHELELATSAELADVRTILSGYAHVRLAELSYEWNEIDAAARHALQALQVSQAERNEEIESYALVTLAQIKQTQGEPDQAIELCNQALTLAHKRNISIEVRFVSARQVKILIQQNRLDDASQVAREMPSVEHPLRFIQGTLVPAASARVMIARREFEQAVQSLAPLRVQVEASGENRTWIEVLALLALARQGQGDAAQATAMLSRALSFAEPERYVRTFLDLGAPMAELLATTKWEDVTIKQYAHRLLDAFGKEPAIQPSSLRVSSLAEPLSERELEVLRLIEQGFSNQEIAERLVVTVNTVKTHINNIYGKLGVGSRTQALARARELNLH